MHRGRDLIRQQPRTLVETWDGTSWTIANAPNPNGATNSQLQGVSCTSASSCTAVGYFSNSSGRDKPLVETWNGTRWSITAVPRPSDAFYSQLHGVSCVSASWCIAVGLAPDGTRSRPLVETWDGASWTIATTPTLDTPGRLYGVSCTTPSSCIAAGSSGGVVSRPLVETWDGGNWTLDAQPDLGPSSSVGLSAVSCVGAAGCTAVGTFAVTADLVPFAESTFP